MVQILFSILQALRPPLRQPKPAIDPIESMTARERADLPPHHPRCQSC